MAGVTAMEAGNRIIEENIIQTDNKEYRNGRLRIDKRMGQDFPEEL